MGDLRDFSGHHPNGAILPPYLSSSVAGGLRDFPWTDFEETAAEVLHTIHPTKSSERKRARVIFYIQRLLSCSIDCQFNFQVFPYGSVPLKTYLPDGDIDLTVISDPTAEDTLISQIFDVLKQEEVNEHAEFEVTDVQLISAEVKLVKCLVQDIIVDISCNQSGGLCTLSFLEQIDRLVDKDHLFKRSIILIKAWCYYESRILGATHGLFSTYALEVLVLYIFHIYHSSLKGPFSVLYCFLDYFSKFDWESHCVSLHGPVCKASLPDIVVHAPEVAIHSLLLSKQFLTNSTGLFKVPPRDHGKQSRSFQLKFINIIDPLKDDNNLGRSVHQANALRIQSALNFAARQLDQILSLPTESTRKELKSKFFRNTMARHRGRVQGSSQPSYSRSSSSFQSSDVDSSTGVRSPRAETEGTSDSSSQASDSPSYHVGSPLEVGHPFGIPLEGAWGESPSNNTVLNSPSAIEVGADKCGEPKSIGIIHESVENVLPLCNQYGNTHSVARGSKLSTARVPSGNQIWNVIDHNKMSEPLNTFSDLTGDYESHLKSVYYGQSFHVNPTIPNVYNKPAWDMLFMHQKPLNFGQDNHSPTYALWGQLYPQVRGTGTYIPRVDLGSWKERKQPSVRRERRSAEGRSPTFQSYHSDNKFGLGTIPFQANVSEHHRPELLKSRGYSENLPEEKDEPDDTLETERNPKPLAMRIPEQNLADAEDSLLISGEEQPYQLKDEVDFPPLASEVAIRRSISA